MRRTRREIQNDFLSIPQLRVVQQAGNVREDRLRVRLVAVSGLPQGIQRRSTCFCAFVYASTECVSLNY